MTPPAMKLALKEVNPRTYRETNWHAITMPKPIPFSAKKRMNSFHGRSERLLLNAQQRLANQEQSVAMAVETTLALMVLSDIGRATTTHGCHCQ